MYSSGLPMAALVSRAPMKTRASLPVSAVPISGHVMEVELFPTDNPPKYIIQHIINDVIKETRSGEIKYHKSRSAYIVEDKLWEATKIELDSWHSSLPDSDKTTVTVKNKNRYSYFSRSQSYGGSLINVIYVPAPKKKDPGKAVKSNTIILLEL